MNRIRIVLVDDHPVVLAGIAALLRLRDWTDVVGEATSGAAALEVIGRLLPDIAVIDLSLPDMNGLELAHRLTASYPEVRLLALTVHEGPAYLHSLLRTGGRGYLLKRSAPEDLPRAIQAISDGGVYLDPAIAEMALSAPHAGGAPTGSATPELLSSREEEVMRLIAQGFANKEIAGRLDLSAKTVATYKVRASEKLGLHSRAQIVGYAMSRGWLAHDNPAPLEL